jgi:hypothetical protein
MDRNGPCRPVGVRPPGANGGIGSEFEPPRTVPCEPCETIDREPPGFEPDRTDPARIVCKTLTTTCRGRAFVNLFSFSK